MDLYTKTSQVPQTNAKKMYKGVSGRTRIPRLWCNDVFHVRVYDSRTRGFHGPILEKLHRSRIADLVLQRVSLQSSKSRGRL